MHESDLCLSLMFSNFDSLLNCSVSLCLSSHVQQSIEFLGIIYCISYNVFFESLLS